MNRKCSICQKPSDLLSSYKETFICEDCLDYIRGLKLSNKEQYVKPYSVGCGCVNHDTPAQLHDHNHDEKL